MFHANQFYNRSDCGLVLLDRNNLPDYVYGMRPLSGEELSWWHKCDQRIETEVVRRGYKFELELLTEEQLAFLRQAYGNERFAWNYLLSAQLERLEKKEPLMSAFDMNNELTSLKREKDFLKLSPSQSLQVRAGKLMGSITCWFNKKHTGEKPRFKKRGKTRDSVTYPQGVKLECGSMAYVPKLGYVRFINGRGLPAAPTTEPAAKTFTRRLSRAKTERAILGIIKNTTISRDGERHYISFQTESVVERLAHPAASAVGVDVGAVRYVNLSDGCYTLAMGALTKRLEQLALLQRQLSRRVKFSANWNKTKAKINKLHRRIANMRKDFQHKLSTQLSNSHAAVVVEALKIKNMMASAAGTVEKPGKNVRQKTGLNRTIADQSWGEFFRQLGYKLEWRGGHLVEVAPAYTSQECPKCGCISAENRESQAVFGCINPECAFTANADFVASLNIKRRGGNVKHIVHVKGWTSPDSLEVLRSLLGLQNQEFVLG